MTETQDRSWRGRLPPLRWPESSWCRSSSSAARPAPCSASDPRWSAPIRGEYYSYPPMRGEYCGHVTSCVTCIGISTGGTFTTSRSGLGSGSGFFSSSSSLSTVLSLAMSDVKLFVTLQDVKCQVMSGFLKLPCKDNLARDCQPIGSSLPRPVSRVCLSVKSRGQQNIGCWCWWMMMS